MIVTEDLRDFLPSLVRKHEVEAVDVDSFVLDQVERDPAGMLGAIDAMAARRRRHPKTRHDTLGALSVLLPRAAAELTEANNRGE